MKGEDEEKCGWDFGEHGADEFDDEGVDCLDCRYHWIDDGDIDRCKLKAADYISTDVDVVEPCIKFEHKDIKPLRWIKVCRNPGNLVEGYYLKCQKCSGVTWDEENINYCPHCGTKLDPLEPLGSKEKPVEAVGI